jgi:hypothetical protein
MTSPCLAGMISKILLTPNLFVVSPLIQNEKQGREDSRTIRHEGPPAISFPWVKPPERQRWNANLRILIRHVKPIQIAFTARRRSSYRIANERVQKND